MRAGRISSQVKVNDYLIFVFSVSLNVYRVDIDPFPIQRILSFTLNVSSIQYVESEII